MLFKNALSLLLILSVNIALAQQFTLTGKVAFARDGDTVILKESHSKSIYDKPPVMAIIRNGAFNFNLVQTGTELYLLSYHEHSTLLFLDAENTAVTITDDTLTGLAASGNVTQNEFAIFRRLIAEDKKFNEFFLERSKFYRVRDKTDEATLNIMKHRLDSLLEISKAASVSEAVNWVKEHPSSQINGYVLTTFAAGGHNVSGRLPDNELRRIFNSLPDAAKQNSWSRELQAHISGLLIGSTAPDFAQAGPDGKIIKLSDFRGKYLLLDFWASWCVPCRAENPNVVRAYKTYKNRNFDILSISLDNNKTSWLKAIKKDGMPWHHASDLNLRKNHVSVLYDVHAIPANFFIDPNGVIVATNLVGDDLKKKLSDLIKE